MIFGTCCGIVIVIAMGYAMIQIAMSISKENEKKAGRINSYKQKFTYQQNSLQGKEQEIKNAIGHVFANSGDNYYMTYGAASDTLSRILPEIESNLAELRKINADLVKESQREDRSAVISQLEAQVVPAARKMIDAFQEFTRKVSAVSPSKMMDEENYGKINRDYWDSVRAMRQSDAIGYISQCESLLNSDQFEEIYALDIEKLIDCVWFLATEKTFSSSNFQRAEYIFFRIYRRRHVDLVLAELYSKKKMGGEDVLRDLVQNLLKMENDVRLLTRTASGLMWMEAYQSEYMILQSMLATGKEMSAKTQERLHSLTNGGGKAPGGFDVQSSDDALYFDVSALAWRDEEYIGLFENLAFQDKTLSYSLALRDENKELFISQDINVPGTEGILHKFQSVFAEEYGSGASARAVDCHALSGSGEEQMEGILVSSDECRQMGVLIHIARIGKKLIIKFYTLFMPTGTDLAAQKQQALSMYKKLSPTVAMWESSLKDSMLMAVEQLLNATSQSSGEAGNGNSPEEPVF